MSLSSGLSSVTAGFLFTALHIPMPEQGNMAQGSADMVHDEAPQLASTYMAHICQSKPSTSTNKQGVPLMVSGLLSSF